VLIGDNRTDVVALAGGIFYQAPEQQPADFYGYSRPRFEIEVERVVDDLNIRSGEDVLKGDNGADGTGGGNDLLIGDHHTTVAALVGGIVFEVPVLEDHHCGSHHRPELEIEIEDLVDDLKICGRGDELNGNDGDDLLIGDSHTRVAAVAGNILLAGGSLEIEIEELVDELEIEGDDDIIDGGSGDDVLIGDNKTEVRAGLTSLFAADSHIEIEIYQLVDELEIEGEDDSLSGGDGNDLLVGDNCTLVSALVSDIQVDGGYFKFAVNELVDDLEIEGNDDIIDGGSGDDVLIGDNRSTVLAGVDNIFIDADRVKIDIEELVDHLYIEGEEDRLDGGDGNDLMGGDNHTVIKTRTDAVEITGRSRKVKIDIDDAVDHLDVDGDDDILIGGAGDDTLYGQQDRDKLYGGEGDDTLIGGSGRDKLDGGPGDDVLNYRTAAKSFGQFGINGCASWVNDFVGDLAFDDEIFNPNGNIEIMLSEKKGKIKIKG
jgi:Ca2+-binding RTX toxin-like protein